MQGKPFGGQTGEILRSHCAQHLTIIVHAYTSTYTVYYVGKHAPRMLWCKVQLVYSYVSWLLLLTRYTCMCIWFRLRVALVEFIHYIGYVYTFKCYVCCIYALCLLRLCVMFLAFMRN